MLKLTMNRVKKMIEDKIDIKIDFRTHVFITNEYGSCPQVDYSTMRDIIISLFDVFDLDIMCQNSDMMLNQLKSTSLKIMIENLIERYNQDIEAITTIEDIEIYDNAIEDDNGLFNILEISVGVTLNSGSLFIDFQTSQIDYTRFSTSLKAYTDGSFDLSDLSNNENRAYEILTYIEKKSDVQNKYNDYISSNYKLVNTPFDWETQREENFLAKRIE